jgi:hypothetical protein
MKRASGGSQAVDVSAFHFLLPNPHARIKALAVGQVLLLEPGKSGLDLGEAVFVGEILDLRRECRRVGHPVVFK